MEKLLTFNLAADKEKKIKETLNPLGTSVIRIEPRDYGQSLGYLCGIDGFTKNKVLAGLPMTVRDEMLVFSGVTAERLEVLLDALEEAKVSSVKRKAVVTMYNVKWTAVELYNEISKEAGL